jgi:hypothetical protein
MSPEETCRLAAELAEKYGDFAVRVAARAVVTYESEGLTERATLWRALGAILDDIAANRLDPRGHIAIH